MHPNGFGALIKGCAVCSKPRDKTHTCPHCGIMFYCSHEHRIAHLGKHRCACEAVTHSRRVLRSEEKRLRDSVLPMNPFKCFNGEFWTIEATRDYMLARMDLVKALRRLRTQESVQEQLEHAQHMLQLSSNDDIMARIAVPALLLRMNRDQECYDLVNTWRKTGKACDFRWESRELSTPPGADVDVKQTNVFDPVDHLCDHDPNLNDGTVLEHSVAMMLLKVKLLIDLTACQKAVIFEDTSLGRRLPREILDQIRGFVPRSSIVSSDRRLLEKMDYSADMADLKHQIDWLYRVVKKMSDRFWPVMLDHYDTFEGRFRIHDRVGAAECPGGLRNSYDSWIETPGAIEFLRVKIRDDPTSLKFIYLLS